MSIQSTNTLGEYLAAAVLVLGGGGALDRAGRHGRWPRRAWRPAAVRGRRGWRAGVRARRPWRADVRGAAAGVLGGGLERAGAGAAAMRPCCSGMRDCPRLHGRPPPPSLSRL